jgi:Na+/proline symporter/signal transduction histidine kinase
MALNIDVVLVVAYLGFTLYTGLGYGKGIKTLEAFALGSRNFSTGALAATITATYISGSSFLIGITYGYLDGLLKFFSSLAVVVNMLVIVHIFIPRMSEFLGDVSIATAMRRLFGNKVGIIIGIFASSIPAGMIAMQLKILSSTFVYFFPGTDATIAVIVFALVMVIYSMSGGIRAVIITDILQFITFMMVIPCIGIAVWSQLVANPEIDAAAEIYNHAAALKSVSGNDYLTLYLLVLVPGFSQTFFQRIAASKNVTQAADAYKYSAYIYAIYVFVAALIGMMLFVYQPGLQKEEIFPFMLDQFTFPGLKGLTFIAIIAMAMSTADSHLNSFAVLFSRDICKQLGYFKSDQDELKLARFSTLIIGSIATVFAIHFKDFIQLLLFAANFYDPVVTPAFLLAIMGFRSSSRAVLIGIFSGLTTVICWKIAQLFIPHILTMDSLFPGICANLISYLSAHYLLGEPGGWVGPKETASLELAKRENARSWSKIKANISGLYDALFFFGANSLHLHVRSSMHLLLGVLIIASYAVVTISEPSIAEQKHYIYVMQFISSAIAGILIVSPLWSSSSNKLLTSITLYALIYLVASNFILMLSHSFSNITMVSFLASSFAVVFFGRAFITASVVLISTLLGYLVFILYDNSDLTFANADFKLVLAYIAFALAFILLPFMDRQQDEIEALSESGERLEHMNEMLNSELQLSQGNLQRSMNMQKNIIRNINHEIRTPMSVLLTNSEILLDHMQNPGRLLQEESVVVAKAIHENIKRFIKYAGSMLDLSDYQNDKMLFKIEKHNLKTLIQSLEKKYSNILLKYDADIPEILEFDELKMTELFEELIQNANQFSSLPREQKKEAAAGKIKKVTEEGGPIEFSVTKGEEVTFDNKKWETLHIRVKDSGIGVPLGEERRIFEPFYLSSATRDSSGGKGLGLSIAEEIMRGHFGKIYASPNTGPHGVTIHVILPVLHPKSDFLAGEKMAEVLPEIDLGKMISDMKNVENKFGGRKPKVLMIEDEKSVLLSAEMMVSALGYEFKGIMIGEEAIEYVKSDEFNADIVLLDMMLPDTTGLMVMNEVCEKLKALNVPVIIQSGLTEHDDNIQKTIELGAKGFIGKPYSRKEFQETIKRMLGLG